MSALVSIRRMTAGLWRWYCRPCDVVYGAPHAGILAQAVHHADVWHTSPGAQAVRRADMWHTSPRRAWPSGMADPEPGCTCDPYGAATCHDHDHGRTTA